MKCYFNVLVLFFLILNQMNSEVHGTCATEKYYVRQEFRDKGCPSGDIAFTVAVPSKTLCTDICSKTSVCKCVSYNSADYTCIGCTEIYGVINGLLEKPGHVIYESELHKDDCVDSECKNGATCVDEVYAYTCICPSGWSGELCQTDIDECASNPCQNGGTCKNEQNQYSCNCVAGWAGTNCDIDFDECSSSPCLNGATCTHGIDVYTCTCADGWTGPTCDTDIDECSSSPCKNGATCVNGINKYTCSCAPGWTGLSCEEDIDECANNPCQNGGTCTNGQNQYTCNCVAGWTGSNCDIDFDECSSSPCLNGATCTHGIGVYTCTCADGWTGPTCDTDIDECSSSPCKNGAMCSNGINKYTCSCAPGWTGLSCEEDIDECLNSPCLNGATCNNGLNDYTCLCAPGWTGPNCNQAQVLSGRQVGTEFITGFMYFGLSNDGVPKLIIVSAVSSTTNVYVTIPTLGIAQQHHVLDEILYLTYPNSLLPPMSTIKTSLAVEVISDLPIALFIESSKSGLIGCTLVLPTSSLSNQYIVNAHDVTVNGNPQILVIAAYDDTAVTLNLPFASPVNINLHKYDVYQYRSSASSGALAGTIISANNPVAVNVGHNCANVPTAAVSYCEIMFTSVPPIETIGRVYVVPYQKTRSGYSIGVSAPYDNTEITFWDIYQSVISLDNINSQQSVFKTFTDSGIISITSSQNILVSQYGHGGSGALGDPSQMIVPSVNQFTSSHEFAVSDSMTSERYVSVVIDVTYGTSGLLLNGSPPTIVESHTITVPVGGTFQVVYFTVNSSIKYTLNHINTQAKFAALLYARRSASEYTTSLGFEL